MLHTSREPTALYPSTLDLARDLDRRISDQIMKWRMFSTNWTLETEDYYGKPIRYRGIRFEGSPRQVFWGGHIEPFLKEGAKELIGKVSKQCEEKCLKPEAYLYELEELLDQLTVKTYCDMSRTDQVLRGDGFPDSVEPVAIDRRITAMKTYIQDHIQVCLHTGPFQKGEVPKILELKPGAWGISFDLRVLWRVISDRLHRRRAQQSAAADADKPRG